jgi:hypothetical protein
MSVIKVPNIKIHENLFHGTPVTDRQTDMANLRVVVLV